MVRRANLKRSVRAALIRGLRRYGERVFSLSQQTERCYVPVDKGTLKDSGYTKKLENGIEIGYTAPYAAIVEFGGPGEVFEGSQSVHIREHDVRGHFRTRVEGDQIWISPHVRGPYTRVYESQRLIGFRPKHSKFERETKTIFRVVDSGADREGQFYLTRANRDSLPDLPKDIEFAMRQIKGAK
tara:strand:+ start:2970 stop:3521 length:552 start_codon:yes stop_codon:yes gene_type:complete